MKSKNIYSFACEPFSSSVDRTKSISPLAPLPDGENNWRGSYRKDHFLT